MNTEPIEAIADQLVEAGWVVVIRCVLGDKVPWRVIATHENKPGVRHMVHSDEIADVFHYLKHELLVKSSE